MGVGSSSESRRRSPDGKYHVLVVYKSRIPNDDGSYTDDLEECAFHGGHAVEGCPQCPAHKRLTMYGSDTFEKAVAHLDVTLSTTPPFSKADQGCLVQINGHCVFVDGKQRQVNWGSQAPIDHLTGKIKSVEEKINGKILLEDGQEFPNGCSAGSFNGSHGNLSSSFAMNGRRGTLLPSYTVTGEASLHSYCTGQIQEFQVHV